MGDASIRKFFAHYGRYRAPTGTFYHRQLRDRLAEIGFKVLSVERVDSHPLWRIRLKGSLKVQAGWLKIKPATTQGSDGRDDKMRMLSGPRS